MSKLERKTAEELRDISRISRLIPSQTVTSDLPQKLARKIQGKEEVSFRTSVILNSIIKSVLPRFFALGILKESEWDLKKNTLSANELASYFLEKLKLAKEKDQVLDYLYFTLEIKETEKESFEEKHHEILSKLASLFLQTPSPVVFLDEKVQINNLFYETNPAFQKLYSRQKLASFKTIFDIFPDFKISLKDLEKVQNGDKLTFEYQIGVQQFKFTIMRGIDGFSNLILRGDDVTQENKQRKELETLCKKLEILSDKDTLTGLSNRRCFEKRLKIEITRSKRFKEPLSLVLLDIDFFKKVNDSYGHLIGDEVLKDIADLVNQARTDIDVVARYGGEEFVMILPNTKIEGAERFAERIRKWVEESIFEYDDECFKITVSLGISELNLLNEDLELKTERKCLIEQADKALYSAKESGRNRVVSYFDKKIVEIEKVAKNRKKT